MSIQVGDYVVFVRRHDIWMQTEIVRRHPGAYLVKQIDGHAVKVDVGTNEAWFDIRRLERVRNKCPFG